MRWAVVSISAVVGLVIGVTAYRLSPSGPFAQREPPAPPPRVAGLLDQFDLTDLVRDKDLFIAGGPPKDGIPAITDPKMIPAAGAEYPAPEQRVIEAAVGGEAHAFPLGILTKHEIVNTTVGGAPVSVTYCPLCDSAAVVERRLDGELLEFGVSGLLYNSNVVMYDRTTNGLWSQVDMRALSGPHAGRSLPHLPVRVVSFERFLRDHPDGLVMSTDTGFDREYTTYSAPYQWYFDDPEQIFRGISGHDDRLPPKTLGLGVLTGDAQAVFVPADAARGDGRVVRTPAGPVRVVADDAGVRVDAAPPGVRTMQTFYHTWSAFHPTTEIAGP